MLPRNLRAQYQDHGIVLFLGAGVSMRSRLPSWEELLRRLYSQIIRKRSGAPSFVSLRSQTNVITAGGILERLSRARSTPFPTLVRHALYRDFPFFSKDVRDPKYRKSFIRSIQRNNPTLRSVASICALESGGGFEANPRVHAIVNFNLDALLRSYASVKYGLILRTIERPSAGPRLGRINVYYPHGFLDFDAACIDDLRKESPDRLVLSEGAYFDFFNRPTELFTYTLLTLLREHTCIFVGLSMQDENVRRLLHYSFQERLASYRVEGHRALKGETRATRHYALLRKSTNSHLDQWQQHSLEALGVRGVFLNSFDEIPNIFKGLYESSGARWNSVW